MRQLAFALIILISVSTHAQMCIDLFTVGPYIKDLEEYSLRRFTPSVDKSTESTEAYTYWRRRVGEPVFVFQNFIRWNKTTHVSLHISPKQDVVVSIGSDKVVRIIHATTHKILKTIKIENSGDFLKSDDYRIIAVTDSHFVIAVEHVWHHSKYEEMGLRMFRPEKLMAIDFNGTLLGSYYSDVVIKGSLYMESTKSWIVADQSTVEVIKLPQSSSTQVSFAISHLLHTSLVSGHYVSAIGLSRDGNTLYVAMSKKKHKDPTSELLRIDISNIDKPQLVSTQTVDLSQVYSIVEQANGGLKIKGSHVIDHSSDPMVEITTQ